MWEAARGASAVPGPWTARPTVRTHHIDCDHAYLVASASRETRHPVVGAAYADFAAQAARWFAFLTGGGVLDVSVGGTYDRFRAAHDISATPGSDTGSTDTANSPPGQARTAFTSARPGKLSQPSGTREHSVRWTTGTILADHKAMLLPPRLLRASRRACPADRDS